MEIEPTDCCAEFALFNIGRLVTDHRVEDDPPCSVCDWSPLSMHEFLIMAGLHVEPHILAAELDTDLETFTVPMNPFCDMLRRSSLASVDQVLPPHFIRTESIESNVHILNDNWVLAAVTNTEPQFVRGDQELTMLLQPL